MRTLLFGRNGQVGWELERCLGVLGDLVAVDRAAVDLMDTDAIRREIDRMRPDVIVNAAAYTNVDGAETDADNAHAINALAPQAMAQAARAVNALLVHYSTDYVFDGSKDGAWVEDDATGPLNVYGRTKLAGELAIRASGAAHLILRTSWVYASRGRNFVRTILRLAQQRDVLRVVADQHGAPTWARFIAQATVMLVRRAMTDARARALAEAGETIHLANGGATSWHAFASRACAKYAAATGATLARIDPIPASEYKTAAVRPANSRMDLTRLTQRWGVFAPDWTQACDLVVAEIVEREAAA
jgi:dTDP-4-dehydrorhamnose reductase